MSCEDTHRLASMIQVRYEEGQIRCLSSESVLLSNSYSKVLYLAVRNE